MTSELQLRLLELLQPAVSQEKAREIVLTIERTVDNPIAQYPGLATSADIKEMIRSMDTQFNRVNDRIEKLIYYIIGQFIALVGIMFTIAKLIP